MRKRYSANIFTFTYVHLLMINCIWVNVWEWVLGTCTYLDERPRQFRCTHEEGAELVCVLEKHVQDGRLPNLRHHLKEYGTRQNAVTNTDDHCYLKCEWVRVT